MSGDCIPCKTLNGIVVQHNGWIRDSSGTLIGRLCDDVKFDDFTENSSTVEQIGGDVVEENKELRELLHRALKFISNSALTGNAWEIIKELNEALKEK